MDTPFAPILPAFLIACPSVWRYCRLGCLTCRFFTGKQQSPPQIRQLRQLRPHFRQPKLPASRFRPLLYPHLRHSFCRRAGCFLPSQPTTCLFRRTSTPCYHILHIAPYGGFRQQISCPASANNNVHRNSGRHPTRNF